MLFNAGNNTIIVKRLLLFDHQYAVLAEQTVSKLLC